MFQTIINLLRDKLHPLYHLRKSQFFINNVMPIIDLRVWWQLKGIPHPIRIHLVRHLPWILGGSILEPGINTLFIAIEKTIKPKIFWDIGANIGYYSWLMLSLDPSMEILLFEPDPDHIVLINDTIARLDSTVKLMPYAVSDREGKVSFALDKASGATGSMATDITFNKRQLGWEPKQITVETISLDNLYASKNYPAPDLIKIDVEMCEQLVFRGAKKLFAEAEPIIIFECADFNKEECLSMLKELDYTLYNADSPKLTLDDAINFLALPKRYRHHYDQIQKEWLLEYKF